MSANADGYAELERRFGATIPVETLEAIAASLPPFEAPAGTTDAFLAESRRERDAD